MKRNRSLLNVPTIVLVLCAFATTTVALGASNGQEIRQVAQQQKKEIRSLASKTEVKKLAQENNASNEKKRVVTVTNVTDKPLNNINIKLSGKDSNDFNQTNNCGQKLGKGKSCTINVTFLPKTPGAKSATMEVLSSEGTQIVPLTGAGI